jgi:ABC-type dipeptide/oligopeptide/nickel transport system permease subunit
MDLVWFLLGLFLLILVAWDVFETIVLPRRASNRIRTTSLVYRLTWTPWAGVARRLAPGNLRENFLGYYGPLAVLVLLIVWAVLLVVGYAGLQWTAGSQLSASPGPAGLADDLYFSATTFFTLGLGDVFPRTGVARVIRSEVLSLREQPYVDAAVAAGALLFDELSKVNPPK